MTEVLKRHRKKNCIKCGEYKWLRDFPKLSGTSLPGKDGHANVCKICKAAYDKIRKEKQRQARNPDRIYYGTVRFGKYTYTGAIQVIHGIRHPYWTEQKQREFSEEYPTTLNADLADKWMISISQVRRLAKRWNLVKDPDWVKHLQKQHIKEAQRHNKIFGTVQVCNIVELGKPYRFKKGIGANLTPEQQQAKIKKTWETRHANMLRQRREETIKQIKAEKYADIHK